MMEIWEESAKFNTTSQRLADQVLNKSWLFGLVMVEIYGQVSCEKYIQE